MRWLARALGQKDELLLDVPAPKRKPGPTQRAKDKQRIIERARQMRYDLGLEWKL